MNLMRELPMLYFTPRERQVLELLLEAALTKDIANALQIRPGSVYPLMAGLRSKLGISNDRELVRWAVQHEPDVRHGCTRAYVAEPRAA